MEKKQNQKLQTNEEISKSCSMTRKILNHWVIDAILWMTLGFFIKTILINFGLWTECPLLSECERCFTYGRILP